MNPLVSIIIPVYNREKLVSKTLDSILLQTYTNWECIIVDDDSTDDTFNVLLDYAKKDVRIKPYKRPSHLQKGANSCRNFGFEKSKGDYVNWFDSDDILYSTFIESKIYEFFKIPSLIAVYSSHDVLNESTNEKTDAVVYRTHNFFKEYLLWNLKIITNSIMFKSQFLEGKELYKPNLTRGQETEFFSRIFENIDNNKIGYVNRKLFLYFVNTSSKSSQQYNINHINSRIYIFKDILTRLGKDKDIKQKFLRDFHLLMYAAYINNDQDTFNKISKELLEITPDFSFRIFHNTLKLSIQNLGKRRGRALQWIKNKNFRNYKIQAV